MRELSLQEIQQASLEVLIEVDAICKRLGIKYFLMYGTLIGAIRHKGFIPWDDDLDIGMLRSDFSKLMSFFESEYTGNLKMCCRAKTKGYAYGIPRICNSKYKYVSTVKTYKYKNGEFKDSEMGVFIDMYPIDNYGSTKEEAELIRKKCKKANFLYSIYNDYKSTQKIYYIPIKAVISLYLHLKNGNSWGQRIDQEIFDIVQDCTSDDDRYIGLITWSNICVLYERKWFDEQIMVEFEGYMFPAPVDYQKVLSASYRDYMVLPPEESRVPYHDYKIYLDDVSKGRK